VGLSPGYLEIAKGICILMVVVGHSLAAVVNFMSENEQLFFTFIGKAVVPAVFCLIYLFGYGQGLKRKRVTRRLNVERVLDMLIPYFFWAALAMVVYFLSEERMNYPFTGREIFGKEVTPLSGLLGVITFTGSWQYYFLFILIFFQLFSGILKKTNPLNHPQILKYSFFVELSIITALTLIIWFSSPERLNLLIIGLFIYPNPILWFFPFFWGYARATQKKEVFPCFRKTGFYMFLVLLLLSGIEAIAFVRKWHTYFIIDQFSVFTLVMSIFALSNLGVISHRIESLWLNQKKRPVKKENKVFQYTLNSCYRYLTLYGRFSYVLFLTHLPFQWFLLIWFEKIIGFQVSYVAEFFLMAIFGILFCFGIIKLSGILPKKIRRLAIGF
jgi:hypothetical protein